jgi:hypothetical protein
VPDTRIYYEGERPVRVAYFIGGALLGEALRDPLRAEPVCEELKRGFAADCLIGNWDVLDRRLVKVVVAHDGTVYRVDNGAALRRWGPGTYKSPEEFTAEVRELAELRDGHTHTVAASLFRELSNADIARQIRGHITPNRAAVLDCVESPLKDILRQRIAYMEQWATEKGA